MIFLVETNMPVMFQDIVLLYHIKVQLAVLIKIIIYLERVCLIDRQSRL